MSFLIGIDKTATLNLEGEPSIIVIKEKSYLQINIGEKKYKISRINVDSDEIMTTIVNDLTGLAILLSAKGGKTITFATTSGDLATALKMKISSEGISLNKIRM